MNKIIEASNSKTVVENEASTSKTSQIISLFNPNTVSKQNHSTPGQITQEIRYRETAIALANSENLLNIFEFIEVVEFPINTFMLDKFWHCIAENRSVDVHGTVLTWLGYESKNEYDNKATFIQLLNSHGIQFKQIKHTDPEFQEYPELIEEAKSLHANALNRKKWIIMNSDDFKEMVMCLQTKKASFIRKYYLSLEKLIKMYGEYTYLFQLQKTTAELEENMKKLAIKDQELTTKNQEKEQEANARKQAEQELEKTKSKLRSETSKLKEQLRKTLDFNQATKKVEPTEYIYIVTTAQYQQSNKFKVGGCQSFELVKSRLTQYNSGESDANNHFFVYLRKTVSFKSIEHSVSGMLMGFKENKSKELYFIHYDWLVKCLDSIIDGSAEFMLYVNENREKIVEDTINKEPTISPPIQLEQIKISYLRAGDEAKEIQLTSSKLDDEIIESIKKAIESYQSENNLVKRADFEEHLRNTNPSVKLEKKKRDVWKVVQQIGSALNPMWRFKY